MKAKLRPAIAALLALGAASACAQPAPSIAAAKTGELPAPPFQPAQTVPGSYIVQAPGEGEQAIRRVFAQYGVMLVRPLGQEQFEVRLARDPGLEALQKLASGSRGAVMTVQPNFIYRMQP